MWQMKVTTLDLAGLPTVHHVETKTPGPTPVPGQLHLQAGAVRRRAVGR